MNPEYQKWIDENVNSDGYGECEEITSRMAIVFPELIRVKGHYYCLIWGERGHWWLKTTDGEIIDPTKEQFPSKGLGHYEEWDDSRPEPTGICMNCGEYVWDDNYFCSKRCEAIVRAEMRI